MLLFALMAFMPWLLSLRSFGESIKRAIRLTICILHKIISGVWVMKKSVLNLTFLSATLLFGLGASLTARAGGITLRERRDLHYDRQDIRRDTHNIRSDRRDINSDRRDLRADSREFRHDRREGDSAAELRAERRDIVRDRRVLNQDRRDIRDDRRDRRVDVREYRSDREDNRRD